MRIELVIDELVLTGFDSRDKHQIAETVTRALSARLTAADAMAMARTGDGHTVARAIAASLGAQRPTHSTRMNGDV